LRKLLRKKKRPGKKLSIKNIIKKQYFRIIETVIKNIPGGYFKNLRGV